MSNSLTEIELTAVDVRPQPDAPLVYNATRLPEEDFSLITCTEPVESLVSQTLNDSQPLEAEYVNTQYGRVLVTIQGDRSKPAFLTYHDLGLNSVTQFHGFFNFTDMEPIMESFCAYHVNAPGQESNAEPLPPNYIYPTCDQLAETVASVVDYFKLKSAVCFGIGLGANILARYALNHPDRVTGAVLINCVSTKCGWIEWGYQKWNNWYLNSGQLTAFTQNYLLWHHFGYQTWETNHDLVQTYSNILTKGIHPHNLSLLISAYINRTDLGIQRQEMDIDSATPSSTVIKTFNFRCPVMNVIGDSSPHEDDVIETNGRLNPTNSSLVKFADCGGMILEEQPAKLAESLRYFLQGLGYITHLSVSRYSLANRLSKQAIMQKRMSTQQSADNKELKALQDQHNVIQEEQHHVTA